MQLKFAPKELGGKLTEVMGLYKLVTKAIKLNWRRAQQTDYFSLALLGVYMISIVCSTGQDMVSFGKVMDAG